jgi:RNA 2',3'-cyclic 3'-phosphodiesterase
MTAKSRFGSAATPESDSWRTFVAIELPEDVRAALQPAIDALEPMKDAVRVNAVNRIHLTLHFLGQIPVAEIAGLQAQLSEAAAGAGHFELLAQGVGAFPNFSRPQVLWSGIAEPGLPALMSLQAALGTVIRDRGLTLEDRFHPHLTLARVRRPIRGPARKPFRDWQQRWADAKFGTIPVRNITLFRSEMGVGPPRYSTIATFELQ